jgi:CO/xanthine dehydrogenase FAD-binding subunit
VSTTKPAPAPTLETISWDGTIATIELSYGEVLVVDVDIEDDQRGRVYSTRVVSGSVAARAWLDSKAEEQILRDWDLSVSEAA